MGWLNPAQFERDHNGQRNYCAADGHEGTERNPLVLDDGGYRVHVSHFSEPDTQFRRQQDTDEDVA